MSEPDAADEDLASLLLSLIAEVKALNLKVATLRELLREHVGVTDALYEATHARVTAAVQALAPDGPPRAKH